MTTTHDNRPLVESVMGAIKEGRVHMRPRWQFVLFSAMSALGITILFLALLYTISLLVFFMQASGVWFAPVFGLRGWGSLFRSLPWLLFFFIAVFIVTLQIMAKRYSFVYRTPLIISVAGVIVLVVGGGYAVSYTSLHHRIAVFEHSHPFPSFVGNWYRHPRRATHVPDVLTGKVVSSSTSTLVIVDSDGDTDNGTSTILITPDTRLPYDDKFDSDDVIMVIGDSVATGTMRAYGIRKIDDQD